MKLTEKKIKVLFIIDTLEVGGAEQSLIKIALKFKTVTPVFLYVYESSTFLANKLLSNNIKVISLNIPHGYHFNKALKQVIPVVKKVQPDIIHTTLFKSDIIGRKLKKFYDVPLVNSLVNNSYIKERFQNLNYIDKLKLYSFQIYDRLTSRNVDLFISNSKAIQYTNSVALNIPLNKIQVIPRGRDNKEFKQIEFQEEQKIKKKIGIANQKILLNVSRLIDRKGQLDLLKAFKKVVKIHPDLVLLIAGEGQYRTVLQNFITKNNLDKKIILLGNRNDIPTLLGIADLFVFPSWYEGLPGAIIEAMMAKTPIVASNIPENLECISHDEAIIFKKGDVGDLEKKIVWALQNPDQMIEKAKRAKKSAISKFQISKVSEKYEKTYYNLFEEENS